MILHSRAQHVLGLQQRVRDLMQPRDVVLVMLDRVERHRVRQIGQPRMNAALRRHRHLVILQIEVIDVLLHVPQKEVVRRPILLAEPLGRNRLDLRQKRRH